MAIKKIYECFRQTGEVTNDSIPKPIVQSLVDLGYGENVDDEIKETLVGLSKLAKNSTYEEFEKSFEDELPAIALSAEQMESLKGGAMRALSASAVGAVAAADAVNVKSTRLSASSDTCEGTCVI